MPHIPQPLIAMIAVGAALAMPVAFAQSEPADGRQEAITDAGQPAKQAAPQASGAMSWADVDADKDGAISKDESSKLTSLAQVFDAADADSDGLLTPDEYKAYVARADNPQDGDAG